MGKAGEVEQLVRALRDRIHQGRFVPGHRLIEADLVAEAEIGRSQVREALRRLQDEGLVQIDRNKGASVRRVSRKEVADTLELLLAISLLIADRAIDRREDPDAHAMLCASLDRVRDFRSLASGLDQSRQFMDENARFWDVFAALSDNPVVVDTRMRLETTLFRLVLEGARVTSAKDKWITRHEDILEAVLAGDRRATRRLVTESVWDVRDAILALPDNAFG